jgi:hypothetical protein
VSAPRIERRIIVNRLHLSEIMNESKRHVFDSICLLSYEHSPVAVNVASLQESACLSVAR